MALFFLVCEFAAFYAVPDIRWSLSKDISRVEGLMNVAAVVASDKLCCVGCSNKSLEKALLSDSPTGLITATTNTSHLSFFIFYYTCKIDSIRVIPKLTTVAHWLLRQTHISLSKDEEWSRLTHEAGGESLT